MQENLSVAAYSAGWPQGLRVALVQRGYDVGAGESLTHVVYHVLLSLSMGAKHGYGIIKDVEERTCGSLELEVGTLYAAIERLRDDGLLDKLGAPPDTDERRRYYAVTALGRSVLRAEPECLSGLVDYARDARVLPS